MAFFIIYDLIRLVNVEKTSWNELNGLPTFQPFYPFFESLRPFWTQKKLSDPNENLHSCLYLGKEHFPHRADINFQESPFSTYPIAHGVGTKGGEPAGPIMEAPSNLGSASLFEGASTMVATPQAQSSPQGNYFRSQGLFAQS